MKEGNFCCHKTTERSEKEYKDMINRLSRIEGQVRGLQAMVEADERSGRNDFRLYWNAENVVSKPNYRHGRRGCKY